MKIYCGLKHAQMHFQSGDDNLFSSAVLDYLTDGIVFVAGESVLFVIFGIFFQPPPQINHRLAENLMVLFGNDTGNVQLPGNFKQGCAAVDDLAGTFLNRRQIFLNVNDQQN